MLIYFLERTESSLALIRRSWEDVLRCSGPTDSDLDHWVSDRFGVLDWGPSELIDPNALRTHSSEWCTLVHTFGFVFCLRTMCVQRRQICICCVFFEHDLSPVSRWGEGLTFFDVLRENCFGEFRSFASESSVFRVQRFIGACPFAGRAPALTDLL